MLIGARVALRFGEVSELRRTDVDLKAKTIHVKRGVVASARRSPSANRRTSGVRDIAVPPHLLPILEQHLKEHVALGREDALLFPVRIPDMQVHSNTLRRHWLKALSLAADLGHDLRHTGAVLKSGATLPNSWRGSAPLLADGVAPTTRCAGRDAEIAARMLKVPRSGRSPEAVGAGSQPFGRYAWRHCDLLGVHE